MLTDCIAAISTPMGTGALAIVRMSGSGSFDIADKIFRGMVSPLDIRGRDILVGAIHETESGREIDRVVLSVFRGPGSYTGEDMVEITCHGGRYLPTAILEECLRRGARSAEAGEFTRRAFLNGKLDLIQAEAISGMIEASTRRAHRLAVDQLDRLLSREISSLAERLRELLARIEYEIDFPEEESVGTSEIAERAADVWKRIRDLLESWKEGSVSTDGALVVIAGRPNVGKSSLFNLMAKRTRAIVTPHPGTTRDAIEQEVSLSGLLVRLVDTAGLRETGDAVEKMGVEVSRKYLEGADIVLFLIDATEGIRQEDEKFLEEMRGRDLIIAANKIDLLESRDGLEPVMGVTPHDLSTKTGEGFEGLKEKIVEVALGGPERDGPTITTLRQKRGLEEALVGLDRLLGGIRETVSAEYLAEDLRFSIRALGELVGEISTEEILEEIFSRFCVGK